MKKKLQLLLVILALGSLTFNAQTLDIGPFNGAPYNQEKALFDFLFGYDIGATGATGAQGLAGICFINDQYWISKWETDALFLLDDTGAFIEQFVISGISQTRSMTTDGTNLYIGTAGLNIYEVDPVTRIISSIINITTTSNAEARMCTYDETLDSGNGGFWIGDFGSDIASVDMSGNELSVIPSTTHNTVIYGGAIDNVSPGGPFLWIHDQSGTAPSRDFIVQIDPATGAPTGVVYDFTLDGFAMGATEVLAGGLFITDEIYPDTVAILGLSQATPSNLLFAIELVPTVGTDEATLQNLSIYPNPTDCGKVTILTSIQGEKEVSVFNILGKEVISTGISNNNLDVSELNSGVYLLQVTQNGLSTTLKLVVN